MFLDIIPNTSNYNASQSSGYFPILLQLGIIIMVALLILVGTHILGPMRKTKQKLINFECGYEQAGNARQPFSIKFFLIAILFVLFDVEVIFFYPYAINFKALEWAGFSAVLMFVIIFLLGFYYILKTKALTWED